MSKKDDAEIQRGRREAHKLGVNKTRRHVLMCVDRKTAKCASRGQMEESWKHLKKRLKELNSTFSLGAFRSKCYCLGICKAGPILVVMPEGTWYGQCSPEVIDQILEQHVVGGKVVDRYVIGQELCSVSINGA